MGATGGVPTTTEASERKLMGKSPFSTATRQGPCRQPLSQDQYKTATLLPIKRWHSTKTRPPDSYSMLLHMDIDRLHLLDNQCLTWPDHVVAVVHLALVHNSSGGAPLIPMHHSTSVEDVVQSVDSSHTFLETTAACALHIELVGQFVPMGSLPGYYPANALKNRALLFAPTKFLVISDANFVITPSMVGDQHGQSLGTGLPSKKELQRRLLNKKEAMLIPGYQVTNSEQDLMFSRIVARDLVIGKGGHEDMSVFLDSDPPFLVFTLGADPSRFLCAASLLNSRVADFPSDSGLLTPFSRDGGGLDMSEPNSSTLLPILTNEAPYWPCIVISASNAPWYDERFVGYPEDSGTPWLNYLAASKFSFSRHPYAFAVHVPHKQLPPRSKYVQKESEALSGRMKFLERLVDMEIRMGNYVPVRQNCGKENDIDMEVEASKIWNPSNRSYGSDVSNVVDADGVDSLDLKGSEGL